MQKIVPEARMTDPFFSVVVATYNRAATLRRALDSALAQQHAPDFEIIVVDDGSSDSTSQLLEPYRGRIRLIQQANTGPAMARNRAIRQARGRYVCFLDSDDFWFPWALATYRKAIEENGFPSFLVAAIHETTEKKLSSLMLEPGPLRLQIASCYFDHLKSFQMIGCGNMVLDRMRLLEAGCFPEARMNCEDSDLCIRLGEAPGFVLIESPATVAYVRHENSLTFQGLDETLAGVRHMIAWERAGRYPGGKRRENIRAMLLSTHARSTSVGLVRAGRAGDGWALYREGFHFHLRARRWKYLILFPFLVLSRCFR